MLADRFRRRILEQLLRLSPSQIAKLVEARRSGVAIDRLAEWFGVHLLGTPSDHTYVTQPNGLRATPQPPAIADNRASSTTSHVNSSPAHDHAEGLGQGSDAEKASTFSTVATAQNGANTIPTLRPCRVTRGW